MTYMGTCWHCGNIYTRSGCGCWGIKKEIAQ